MVKIDWQNVTGKKFSSITCGAKKLEVSTEQFKFFLFVVMLYFVRMLQVL